jgi:BirA family transcriptional regulator, biotin operon repressor / biotin---[acetyl-CoA-carboxylase] ligase
MVYLELLDQNEILDQLAPHSYQQLKKLLLLDNVDSTNNYLLQYQQELPVACLAEYQTQGRGRGNKVWQSPYASGICLSLKYAYDFKQPLPALSLALAVAIARLLYNLGISAIKIKWPNDIWWQKYKLAGLLIESQWFKQHCHIVIGIGLNVHVTNLQLDQAWTDVYTALGRRISRNYLAAQLINVILNTVQQYGEHGFAPYLADWQVFDALYNKEIRLITQHGELDAIACGIQEDGALLVKIGSKLQAVYSAEVSIKHDFTA